MHAGLNHFLFVSVLLFGTGLYAVITRKNIIMMLIGIEFIFSAVNLNFIAFQKFTQISSEGQAISVFIIILTSVQSIMAAGIILNFYKRFHLISMNKTGDNKE